MNNRLSNFEFTDLTLQLTKTIKILLIKGICKKTFQTYIILVAVAAMYCEISN